MAGSSKKEIRAELASRLDEIERRLQAQTAHERSDLIEELIEDFFVGSRRSLGKWARITGQSSQIDTGYIAQHLASLVLQVPGQGFKGKGLDLRDGSEVKSASIIDGRDRPRWNHNLGTVEADTKRRDKGQSTTGETYLNSTPWMFYVLFDRVYDGGGTPTKQLRVRAWCVEASVDEAWRSVIISFLDQREGNRYNLQLHPPIGYDDDLVVNQLGNLDFASTLVLDVRFVLTDDGGLGQLDWRRARLEANERTGGRAVLSKYALNLDRASRLEALDELRADPDLSGPEL